MDLVSQLESIRPEIVRAGGEQGEDLFNEVACDLIQASGIDCSSPQHALIRWVAKRRRIDLWRRDRSKAHHRLSQKQEIVDTKAPRPQDVLNREEEFAQLRQCVTQLKPNYRQVVEMVFFQGLSHRTTARVLFLPLETVRTRLKRALNLMRQMLSATLEKEAIP